MSTLELSENHADLEGRRVRQLGQDAVYLILDGKRRHIPSRTTYGNLFADSPFNDVLDVDAIPDGGPLSDGAILAKSAADPNYLLSNGQKRHILSPEAMAKYGFIGTVEVLPGVAVHAIPDGDNIPKT